MRRQLLPLLVCLALLTGGACDDGDGGNGADAGADAAADAGLPPGCDQLVSPGADDQAALQTAFIEATPGSTVCLAAGTFALTGELSLAADDVTVSGAGQDDTILDFSGQTVGANGIAITGNGVTFTGLQVLDTPGDGIRATAVTDISFVAVTVQWTAQASLDNGAYGLYPVECTRVRVEQCVVAGASDAGIYVGQSSQIIVSGNDVFGNVAGIEIENSTDAEVFSNNAHDNTAGILVFNLPELPVQGGARAKVHSNTIEDNNLPNFADPGSIVGNVPGGTGIIILASDENEIHDNTIRNNGSFGIVILRYHEALFGFYTDPSFDEYPQTNWIHNNTIELNGADPQGIVFDFVNQGVLPSPVSQISWDGCEDPAVDNSTGAFTNCLSDNGGADYINFDFCGGFLNQTTDASPVTCQHNGLPSITF